MTALLLPGASALERRCDELVAELLAELRLTRVNVDAFAVAARMGIDVVMDAAQAGRARIKRIAGRPTVFLRPEERPERTQWSLAHEIGEAVASRLAADLLEDADELPPRREQWANLFAARLLLPRDGFLPEADRLDGDLVSLKQLFPHVSHEQLLWGLLRLDVPTVASVFDQGRLTRRQGNTGGCVPLTSWERAFWRGIHTSGRHDEETQADYCLQGWAIHEDPWRRELLRVTLRS
jgi:predicted transcriptional regulator